MHYDWNTYRPDGYGVRCHLDTTIQVDSTSLHTLLEAMRAFELLDEITPQPEVPDDCPHEVWYHVWLHISEIRSPHPLRIPAFKLTDPNCWLITWQEWYLLANRLRGVQEPRIQRLVTFAAEAVAKGGFRVC